MNTFVLGEPKTMRLFFLGIFSETFLPVRGGVNGVDALGFELEGRQPSQQISVFSVVAPDFLGMSLAFNPFVNFNYTYLIIFLYCYIIFVYIFKYFLGLVAACLKFGMWKILSMLEKFPYVT